MKPSEDSILNIDATMMFVRSSSQVRLPKLPSWFYKIARFFVKKTAGGLLKLMRDLVNAALEDVERVLEYVNKGGKG